MPCSKSPSTVQLCPCTQRSGYVIILSYSEITSHLTAKMRTGQCKSRIYFTKLENDSCTETIITTWIRTDPQDVSHSSSFNHGTTESSLYMCSTPTTVIAESSRPIRHLCQVRSPTLIATTLSGHFYYCRAPWSVRVQLIRLAVVFPAPPTSGELI